MKAKLFSVAVVLVALAAPAQALASGGGGSGDGDVGEGGEVAESEALGVDGGGEVAVADAGTYGDGFCVGVDGDVLEVSERDLCLGAVGDGVETVPRTENLQVAFCLNIIPNLLKRVRDVQAVSAVDEIACPIFELLD